MMRGSAAHIRFLIANEAEDLTLKPTKMRRA